MAGPHAATLVREETPTVSSPPPPPPAVPPATERRLSRNWALILGIGWPVAVAIATALEPAPANPDAPVSAIAALIGLAFTAGLVAAVATAAGRHTRAPVISMLFGVMALGLVVACPATGHHGFGAWWAAELAVYSGMFAASVGAFRSVTR
jgi:hypothetical protein